MSPGVGFDDRFVNPQTMSPTATPMIMGSRAQFNALWICRLRRPGAGKAKRQSSRTGPALRTQMG
jgi:hypothetical protein